MEVIPCSNNAVDSGPSLTNFCLDNWTWNIQDKSDDVVLRGNNLKTVHFHPGGSNGTAGARSTKVLNNGIYYWEITISDRLFGTSIMLGIGTKQTRLHAEEFVNMLGEDEHSWGLSHEGLLWHKGKWRQYIPSFREFRETTIGLLFDGIKGTLWYYKDGYSLGLAFKDLNLVKDELYPIVCSTTAQSEMSLCKTMRGFNGLQDRCRTAVISTLKQKSDLDYLRLPKRLKSYLIEDFSKIIDSKMSSPNH